MNIWDTYPNDYERLLAAKVRTSQNWTNTDVDNLQHATVKEQFSTLGMPEIEVFASPKEHYRMRAEFTIWFEGEPRRTLRSQSACWSSESKCALVERSAV